jgi:hypothetical protein
MRGYGLNVRQQVGTLVGQSKPQRVPQNKGQGGSRQGNGTPVAWGCRLSLTEFEWESLFTVL